MSRALATVNDIRGLLYSPQGMEQIKQAVRTNVDPKTLARIAITALQRSPKLQECTRESFFGALLTAVQMGLEPDNVTGQAYLVPYKNVCTLIPGYKGLIQLAMRSGMVRSIRAVNVFANEPHTIDLSLSPCVQGHKPLPPSKRGEYVGSYAIAHMEGGGVASEWMWAEEVWKIRDRSPAAKSSMSPWTHADDQYEMCRKTVVRRLSKYLPSSPTFQRAITLDTQADVGEPQNFDDVKVAFVDQDGESEPATKTNRLKAELGVPASDRSKLLATVLALDPEKRAPILKQHGIDPAKAKADIDALDAEAANNLRIDVEAA